MNRSVRNRLQSTGAAAFATATGVEALRIGEPLLAALSTLAAAGAVAVLVGGRRPVFELRPDLAAWVQRTAAAGGDDEDRIVSGAVARQRDGIDGPPGGSPRGRS
ncbi:MAG: hypothetical protein RLZZ01_2631 [Actinomycetota bacterium]|jgi:hypothetical protein